MNNSRGITQHLVDVAVTARQPRLAACASQLLSLAFPLPFYLCCFVIWQWSWVINCSIKATLIVRRTLDVKPLGVRVVQLLWRTRLLLATDNQHVPLITRQMDLFMQPSRLIGSLSARLMMRSEVRRGFPRHAGETDICPAPCWYFESRGADRWNLPVAQGEFLMFLNMWKEMQRSAAHDIEPHVKSSQVFFVMLEF